LRRRDRRCRHGDAACRANGCRQTQPTRWAFASRRRRASWPVSNRLLSTSNRPTPGVHPQVCSALN
jgi:hypothetical protein